MGTGIRSRARYAFCRHAAEQYFGGLPRSDATEALQVLHFVFFITDFVT